MIIYDGKYDWSGKKKNHYRPISWWPGFYNIKIIDLSMHNPKIRMIKPVIIVASDTGKGFSAKNYFQNFAKNICRDFGLDFDKILWIVYYPKEPAYMEVAMFEKVTTIGGDNLYSVTWRSIIPNEIEVIKPFFPEAGKIAAHINE